MARILLNHGAVWSWAVIACGSWPAAPRSPAWVGSSTCVACHPQEGRQWSASWHARTLRAPAADELDVLAGLAGCEDLPAEAVLGGRHELRWLHRQPSVAWSAGRWVALPCGLRKATVEEATHHHPVDWRARPFEVTCAACHVTGWSGAARGWAEDGIGCEACHGPGGLHATTLRASDVVRFPETDELTVCAACHLQGARSRRTGQSVPDRHVPGAPLFDDWSFDWATLDEGASPVDVHQKVVVRDRLAGTSTLVCTSCHSLHDLGHARHSTLSQEAVCERCHEPDLRLKEYEQSCAVCEF